MRHKGVTLAGKLLALGLLSVVGLGVSPITPLQAQATKLIKHPQHTKKPTISPKLVHCGMGAMSPACAKACASGIAYFNKGQMLKAIPAFKAAVKSNPSDPATHLWLARALKKQNGPANVELAKTHYRHVLALQPHNVEALSQLGQLLSWNVNTRSEAADLLQHAHKMAPNDAFITARTAETLAWLGRIRQARPLADMVAPQLLKNPTQNHDWLATYAGVLTGTGSAPQAVSLYRSLLANGHQNDVKLKTGYALALAKADQSDMALTLYPGLLSHAMALPVGHNPEQVAAMAGLSYELGKYSDSLTLEDRLPLPWQLATPVRLRHARSLDKAGRTSDSIEAFYKLYGDSLLTADQKMEFADLLQSHHVPASQWPQANLAQTLYNDAIGAYPANSLKHAMAQVRLARLANDDGGTLDNTQYQAILTAYQNAISASGRDPELKQEYLDVLRYDRGHFEQSEAELKRLIAENPDDLGYQLGLADLLSVQEDRRPDAIKLYWRLIESGKGDADTNEKLNKVLGWHKPQASLLPTYEAILKAQPDNRGAKLSVARLYVKQPKTFAQGLALFDSVQVANPTTPDELALQQEWLGALYQQPGRRSEALATLKKLHADRPDDTQIQLSYARMLSYDRRYGEAIKLFNGVLDKDATNKEALVGKGYTILWGGEPLAAKAVLSKARKLYPNDSDVAIALAHANRTLGNYSEALKLMKEVKPSKKSMAPSTPLSLGGSVSHEGAGNRLVAYVNNHPKLNVQWDVAPLESDLIRHSLASASSQDSLKGEGSIGLKSKTQNPTALLSLETKSHDPNLEHDLSQLRQQMDSLQQLQQQSQADLDNMGKDLQQVQEQTPKAVSIPTTPDKAEAYGVLPDTGLYGSNQPLGAQATLQGEGNSLSTPPENTEALEDLDYQLGRVFRPSLTSGFSALIQKGEPTTTRLRGWGFNNELSMSLLPNLRVRGGISPFRYYIPNGKSKGIGPSSTWATHYTWGASTKLGDRLLFSGDMGLLHFTQTDENRLTYNAFAKLDVTDNIKLKVGSRRDPLANSLLSYAGIRPITGRFAGQSLGPAMETSLFAELNLTPLRRVDLNGGYEFGWVRGDNMPNNTKNQFYGSVGYTQPIGQTHSARLAYEALYFGYDKDATLGYFDTVGNRNEPLSRLNPVTVATNGTVFGGYFSPSSFWLNDIRLDVTGSFWNKKLEYKVGGSIGIQHYDRINTNRTSLATTLEANLLYNATDWLGIYTNASFIDSGGFFRRSRFGGGLVLRPDIGWLSPVIK
jgi:tetratricopeptide (TPR) repeat protein